MGNDDAIAGRGQYRRYIDEAMDVVGPTVQQDDRLAVSGTHFSIADIEQACIDLLQGSKGCIASWLGILRRRFRHGGCSKRELGCGNGHCSGFEKTAAMRIDLVSHAHLPFGLARLGPGPAKGNLNLNFVDCVIVRGNSSPFRDASKTSEPGNPFLDTFERTMDFRACAWSLPPGCA